MDHIERADDAGDDVEAHGFDQMDRAADAADGMDQAAAQDEADVEGHALDARPID
jgi:hypothetical protein